MSKLAELHDIEIINVYPNNHGIKFDKKDLIEIKNNFEMLKETGELIPIVKVSHSDSQLLLKHLFQKDDVEEYEEMPLLGVVDKLDLSEDGKSLKATIKNIPEKLLFVFGNLFRAVSPEIVFNWRNTGKKVLRAIALTNMPSQRHITDVSMSGGLVCMAAKIIYEGVQQMTEDKIQLDETLVEKLAEKVKRLFKQEKQDDVVTLSVAQYNELKSEMNDLKKKLIEKEEQAKNFSDYLAKFKEQVRNEKAEAICKNAMAEGVPKIVVDKLKPILLSDIGEKVLNLSQVIDGKAIEANITIMDIIKDLFDNYPGKIDYSDKTVTTLSAPSEDKAQAIKMRVEELRKQGLSEYDALKKAGQEIL